MTRLGQLVRRMLLRPLAGESTLPEIRSAHPEIAQTKRAVDRGTPRHRDVIRKADRQLEMFREYLKTEQFFDAESRRR